MKAEIIVNTFGEETRRDCLTVVLLPDCDTEKLLLRHFDCSVPTFNLDDEGNLRANLEMRRPE